MELIADSTQLMKIAGVPHNISSFVEITNNNHTCFMFILSAAPKLFSTVHSM
jgi:hypothetical protein